jgi:hypothetical protein
MHKERRRKSDRMSREAERKFAVLEIVCKTNMHTNENVDGICAHADPCCPVRAYHYPHIQKKKELSFYKCIARTFLQQLNGFSLELDQLMPLQDWPAIEDRPVPLSLNKVPAREELSKWIGETVYKYEHEKHAS